MSYTKRIVEDDSLQEQLIESANSYPTPPPTKKKLISNEEFEQFKQIARNNTLAMASDTAIWGTQTASRPKSSESKSLKEKTVLSEEEAIIGYKGFDLIDGKLQCLKMEYLLEGIHASGTPVKLCTQGFHFCRTLKQVFNHYDPNDKRHVYYKVKVWGEIDESSDKIAGQFLKIVSPVHPMELKEVKLKESLDQFDLILADNPNAIISGSLALMIMDLIPFREPKDIDVSLTHFSDFKTATVTNEFGASGEECCQMMTEAGLSFDLFINPKTKYNFFTLFGKKYRVADPGEIFKAKFRYLLAGSIKHSKDIKAFQELLLNGRPMGYDSLREEVYIKRQEEAKTLSDKLKYASKKASNNERNPTGMKDLVDSAMTRWELWEEKRNK